jgi:hypothetical protein
MLLVKSLGFLLMGATIASAYDVGCLWPETAPEDLFEARDAIIISNNQAAASGAGRETPIVIHLSHEATMCQGACTAFHSAGGVKDPMTLEPPVFLVPEFGQNGYSILMCIAQCKTYLDLQNTKYMQDVLGLAVFKPNQRPDIKEAMDKCADPGVTGCSGECRDLCILVSEDFDPYIIGAYLALRITKYFDTDGWNRLGDMTYDYETDEKVPCTGSCRSYQNTQGYVPVPDPRSHPQLSNDTSKYDCTGDCRRWQPLQEGDDTGSLKRQEFITPHIGLHAKTYLRNATLTLEDPGYDLYADSLQVIEELKMTSSDDYKKEQIQLMDDKVKLRFLFQGAMKEQFATTGEMSLQDYLMFVTGISTAEIDGVVQAWKEKVALDLVRPTTVIKHWGGDDLFTFSGDRDVDGPVSIKARDFEAFIRVMPHGEFPSGSSCLCKIYQEFTDTYLTDIYGRTITNFDNEYNSKVYEDMNEFSAICGNSRVWAGLHYPQAVTAGVQVCSGLGTLGYEWTKDLTQGADYEEPWYMGTPRPVCNDRRQLRRSV